MKKFFKIGTAVLLLGSAVFVYRSPSDLPTRNEQIALAHALFEFGAIEFVHGRIEATGYEKDVFRKVGDGDVLDEFDSCSYRSAYHAYLATQQRLFSVMDHNIYFANDFGESSQTNCAGFGLSGRHDIHDHSTLQNYENIQADLIALASGNPIARMVAMNDMNKDLVDLVVHMAPAVHAIGVLEAGVLDADHETSFEAMYTAFKVAQFAPINSCIYWRAIDDALENYVDLVGKVYDQALQNTTKLERKIAGIWMTPQTIAPILDVYAPKRPRPNCP